MFRSVVFLILLLFTCLLTCASAQCDPNEIRIALAAPAPGATISAPFEVAAQVYSSCPVTAIQIYLDGVPQWTQYRQAWLRVQIPATTGKHWLHVKAWNWAGTRVVVDNWIQVAASSGQPCRPMQDNWVRLCAPKDYTVLDPPIRFIAGVRSDTAPLRETRITVNGELWARAFGAAAYQPAAALQLPPGLMVLDVASSNTAGAEMHNASNFMIRTQVPCQPPVVSLIRPSGEEGHPAVYFAYADAGHCPITAIKVYVDGAPQYTAFGQPLITGRMRMEVGQHLVTVVAWNSRGEVGKRTSWVTAGDNIEAYCVPESTPGVVLCHGGTWPAGPLLGLGTPLDPPIPTTAGRIYVNGVKRADYYGAALVYGFMLIQLPAGTYTFTGVAWNAAGEVATATETLTVPAGQ